MPKKIEYYKKYWDKLSLENKRDLLVKYYPNPQHKWTITNDIKITIYKEEIYKMLKTNSDDKNSQSNH